MLYFFINIFIRSTYVSICTYFSDEYLILRATANFKNSIFGWLFAKMGIYIKSLLCSFIVLFFIYGAKFQVSNLHIIFLPWDWLRGVFKKLFHSHLSAHWLHISAKFGIYSSYDFRETLSCHNKQLDITNRQTDEFFSASSSRIYMLYRISGISFNLFHTFCLN